MMASKLVSAMVWANGVAASNVIKGDGLCPNSKVTSPQSDWLWDTSAEKYYSCSAALPVTRGPWEVQNNAQQCDGDPTSVVIQANGDPQCLATQMSKCKFNMRTLTQLDFDITLQNCHGTWAAPLWLTPDNWAGGGRSGEIDMVEMCPTSVFASNWAGMVPDIGQVQKSWPYSADSFSGHVTMVIDEDGKVSVNLCKSVGEECAITNGGATYPNIYASNACVRGDCTYKFVSDIWNGLGGDGGYTGCTGLPGQAGNTTTGSQCAFSIRNIRAQASEGAFPSACSALISGSSPKPNPTTSPAPAPSDSCYDGEPVTCSDGTHCAGGECCKDGSTCPSASTSFKSCPHGKLSDCTR